MVTETVWAGLDLGLRQSQVCVINDAGETVFETACETSFQPLSETLSTFPKDMLALIAIEAGPDLYVIRKLRNAGYPIAVFEARKASKFLAIRRNKSDVSDAHGLADLARLGRRTVSQVHLKSLECQQLRSHLAMRNRLVKLRVTADGALRSRLATYGRSFKKVYGPGRIRSLVSAQLAQLEAEEGLDLAEDLNPLIEVCENLRIYLRKLDRDLERMAKDHPVCRRLMQIPGVGPICSLSFYTAIEDPNRFKNASEVAAYLGLVPRRYQSGDVSYTKGITKTGSVMTRTHLVGAAMIFHARGPDSALKTWDAALRERIGPKRARVAVARKLAVILLAMWKTGADFEPYPKADAKLLLETKKRTLANAPTAAAR